MISDVCKPVVLQIVERTAGVSPASAEVRLVSARGADVELTEIRVRDDGEVFLEISI